MSLTRIDLTEQVQNDLPAGQVATSSDRQFLTTEQKAAVTRNASSSQSGLMTAAQSLKLTGIATSANKYTHPSTHPASIITQNCTRRFVTDAEKSSWNGKLGSSGSQNLNGNLTVAGDLSVQGSTVTLNTETIAIEDNLILLNKNQTGIPLGTLNSGVEIERGDKDNALLIFDEKDEKWKISNDNGVSLEGIATEDDSRFLTSSQKSAVTRYATSGQSGLMTSTYASKLNAIANNANNYILPSATASIRGGIKVGSNLLISSSVLSVPDATTSIKGVVKVGNNLSISSGIVNVAVGSALTKGVLKVGSHLTVASGTISVPSANATTNGVSKALITERFISNGGDTFILTNDFGDTSYLAVFRNGLRQWEGSGEDYEREAKTKKIMFKPTPKNGEKIIIDYVPD